MTSQPPYTVDCRNPGDDREAVAECGVRVLRVPDSFYVDPYGVRPPAPMDLVFIGTIVCDGVRDQMRARSVVHFKIERLCKNILMIST